MSSDLSLPSDMHNEDFVVQPGKKAPESSKLRNGILVLTAAGALVAAAAGKFRTQLEDAIHGNPVATWLVEKAPTAIVVFPPEGPLKRDMNGVECESTLTLRYDEGGDEIAGATIQIKLSYEGESMFITLEENAGMLNVDGDIHDPNSKRGLTPERKAIVDHSLTGPDGVLVPPTATIRKNAWNGIPGTNKNEKVAYVKENFAAFTQTVVENVWQLADAKERVDERALAGKTE